MNEKLRKKLLPVECHDRKYLQQKVQVSLSLNSSRICTESDDSSSSSSPSPSAGSAFWGVSSTGTSVNQHPFSFKQPNAMFQQQLLFISWKKEKIEEVPANQINKIYTHQARISCKTHVGDLQHPVNHDFY